jgi:hypothetical protein
MTGAKTHPPPGKSLFWRLFIVPAPVFTGKGHEMMNSFQVTDGRGTTLALYPKKDGGFHVEGTLELSPLDVACMQYAELAIWERIALESMLKREPITKLGGPFDNMPKARLVTKP